MNANEVLNQLIEWGYGESLSLHSQYFGRGLWGMKEGQNQILVFENGFMHDVNNRKTEIKYADVYGIKSAMTIEKLANAQTENIDSLIMRFEYKKQVFDLLFPFEIYSSLLGYFCDQVQSSQHKVISTGTIS